MFEAEALEALVFEDEPMVPRMKRCSGKSVPDSLPDLASGEWLKPDTFYRPGQCAGQHRLVDPKGLWYMPGRGRYLLGRTRLLLRVNRIDTRAFDYLDKIKNHPINLIFASRRGRQWPTRAFLPRWDRATGLTEVGRRGGYGLMYFPPVGNKLLANPYNPGG